MKRIAQIAIEQKVGVNTIIDYCKGLGQSNVNQNSKIDPELESQIIAFLSGEIELQEKNEKDEFQVSGLIELPSDFSLKNPFEPDQIEIITKGERFFDRRKRALKYEDSEIESVFNDFEAYSICMGLENKHAKHIARNFFKTNKQIEKEQFEAHSIAMSTLEKYGEKMLSYIISLPPLPFKAVNVTQIFSELDKRRKIQDFPIIRISFKNDKNEMEKIQISYFAEKYEKGRVRNDNVLTIKNKTTGKRLLRVSREGIVIPENNAKQIVPVLQLFIRFSKDVKQTLLNYGLETGECSICGRELTDSESIRNGIGPVCKQYI